MQPTALNGRRAAAVPHHRRARLSLRRQPSTPPPRRRARLHLRHEHRNLSRCERHRIQLDHALSRLARARGRTRSLASNSSPETVAGIARARAALAPKPCPRALPHARVHRPTHVNWLSEGPTRAHRARAQVQRASDAHGLGLLNLAGNNLCFANAALQSLSVLPDALRRIRDEAEYTKRLRGAACSCVDCMLCDTAVELHYRRHDCWRANMDIRFCLDIEAVKA